MQSFCLRPTSNRYLLHSIYRNKASAVAEAIDIEKETKNASEHTIMHDKDFADPAYKQIDLSFTNAKEAYKSKTNLQLLRSLFVFDMCSIPVFVNKNKEVNLENNQILMR